RPPCPAQPVVSILLHDSRKSLNLCSDGVRGDALLLSPTTLVESPLSIYGIDSLRSLRRMLGEQPDSLERSGVDSATLARYMYVDPREKKNSRNSTIDFLKQFGLDDSQVEKIAKSHPNLLRSKVEKTLIPKIRVLEDFGICGSELISVIASNPSLLNFSTKYLLAKLDFLKSILGSVENVRNVIIKETNRLSSASLTKVLQPNFELLKSYGISDERLQKFLVHNPWCLCHNPKRVQESLVGVEQVLGIPRKSGMFLYGFMVMVSLSKRDLELKFELFKRYGWSESDVLVMAKRFPQCLLTSEAKLKTTMDFFVNKLGYEIGYLAAASMSCWRIVWREDLTRICRHAGFAGEEHVEKKSKYLRCRVP
ncbi:hypothetical protein Dimus_037103, partial [Dionaea muscipula]